MSLNDTPNAERVHIGFFGRRNAGKSSLINAVAGQTVSVVSDVKGTTTDAVRRAMELLPLGPVLLIDTPGIDDVGELGKMRVNAAKREMERTDVGVIVADGKEGVGKEEAELAEMLTKLDIPYIVAINKADLVTKEELARFAPSYIPVSAKTGEGIDALKERLASIKGGGACQKTLFEGLVKPLDTVLLVTPIDASAPKGRIILPQQTAIRDILDKGAIAVTVKDTELREALGKLRKAPDLVVTDSQAFGYVASVLPKNIPLTSFSILFARYKGDLALVANGAYELDKLKDGDTLLISEGCTHHRQCGDIGTEKLPKLILKTTGKKLNFEFTSGSDFPADLSKYALVIHCGGCTLNEKEMKSRQRRAKEQNVPITNYGTAIAHCNGILKRSVAVFGEKL